MDMDTEMSFVSVNNTTAQDQELMCNTQFFFLFIRMQFAHLTVAALVLIILGFVQRRKKLGHKFLWGFPGIVVPMDFLVSPRYRFIYVVTFGVMATSFFQIFQDINMYTPPGLNFYAGIFYRTLLIPFILVLYLSLQYAPLFACVNSNIPLLGHILGFLYSLPWLVNLVVIQLLNISTNICSPTEIDPLNISLFVAVVIPVFGCGVIIVAWYGFKTVQGLLRLCGVLKLDTTTQSFICCGKNMELRATDPPRSTVKFYHVLHVQNLLTSCKNGEPPKDRGKFGNLIIKLVNYIFPYTNDFRLPLAFVGAVFAMSMLLYQLTVGMIIFGSGLSAVLPPLFSTYVTPLLNGAREIALENTRMENETTVLLRALNGAEETIGLILVGLPAFLCISPFVSMLFSLCLLVNMVATVSKNLKTIAREGFKEKLPSANSRVTSSWKYVGHLLGFFFLAWVIYTLIVFVLLTLLAILYLGLKYLTEFAIQGILYIVIPLIWTQLVFFLQTVICRFVFLKKSKGNFIAITNRRLYNWFAFVLFFYNGIAGFVSAILRTIISSIFSLILLFRLDQVILLRGFEQFDFGHKSYLGFIYLYFIYNNAVVHVFIHLLTSSVQGSRTPSDGESMATLNVYSRMNEDGCISVDKLTPNSSRLIRNRWMKAYLLVRNPSLVKYTASNIRSTKPKSMASENSTTNSYDPPTVQMSTDSPTVIIESNCDNA